MNLSSPQKPPMANSQNMTSASNHHQPQAQPKLDRYVIIHVATTCDEHGVYVTKDSAEVIEIGWILLDAKNCEEVWSYDIPVAPSTASGSL